jgi:C4-dicarboxylate transporter DctM subunit
MLPVIIFVGTFSGVFTANEAAVVACMYAFIVELFIHKTMKFRDVKKVVVGSAVTSATLLIIVAGATCFGRYLTFENVPGKIAEAVVENIQSPVVFLLAINLFFLVVGMFLDVISATLIIGPVVIPLLPTFGVDFMHFGLLMTVNLAIGYCTPPVGVSMYITGAMTNKDIVYVTKAVIPFLIIQIAVLFIMTYIPDLVLWLPKAMGFWEAIESSVPAL